MRIVARVQYGMPMTPEQAEVVHATYRKTYPGVPAYWKRQIQETKARGYVETFAGRRVQVVGDWDKDGWRLGSTAINYRIQGTGGDMKYLALAVLRPHLRQLGAHFAWDLHDGLYFYVPDAVVPRAAATVTKLLNTLPYESEWGFSPPIPLPWDCKAGKSWGDLREYHA